MQGAENDLGDIDAFAGEKLRAVAAASGSAQ